MKSQTEQLTRQLERMIEDGTVTPGSMISESQLMALTGFGRTPIREAVQRLALTRMVAIHPNKGIEIRAMSTEDQMSALEARRSLEVLAVTLACERAKPKDLEAMAQQADELMGEFQIQEYALTIRRTHSLIIEATYNPFLEALMMPLQTLSRRFWLMTVRDHEAEISKGKHLHRDILLSICRRDKSAATAGSIALNDYLVDYSLSLLGASRNS